MDSLTWKVIGHQVAYVPKEFLQRYFHENQLWNMQ